AEEISRARGSSVCGGMSNVGASSEGPALADFGVVHFKLRIPGFDPPAAKMLPHNVSQGTNPVVALVEAGQQVKFRASRTEEDFSALDADFFERLQAIRHETRTDHVHAAHAGAGVIGQNGRRIGLYPFRPPKAGLEGDLPVVLGKHESLGKGASGRGSLPWVSIEARTHQTQ